MEQHSQDNGFLNSQLPRVLSHLTPQAPNDEIGHVGILGLCIEIHPLPCSFPINFVEMCRFVRDSATTNPCV